MDLENNLTNPTYTSPPPIPTILSDPPTPLHPSSPADKLTEPLVSEITHPDNAAALPPTRNDDDLQPRPTRVCHPPKWLSDYVCD